jgi:hypothetical protein
MYLFLNRSRARIVQCDEKGGCLVWLRVFTCVCVCAPVVAYSQSRMDCFEVFVCVCMCVCVNTYCRVNQSHH